MRTLSKIMLAGVAGLTFALPAAAAAGAAPAPAAASSLSPATKSAVSGLVRGAAGQGTASRTSKPRTVTIHATGPVAKACGEKFDAVVDLNIWTGHGTWTITTGPCAGATGSF